MTELEVFTPEEANGVTALVFSGEGTLSAADRALCERFAAWGAQALAAPLSREGEVVSDRDATSLATAALKEVLARDDVDPELLVLAGLGRGGTLAVLCACRADGAACVLDLARDVGERVEARVEPEDEGEQQRRVARAGAPAERREVELRRACLG